MIINGPGKYVTESGTLVEVTSWDKTRRAYGTDANGKEISWYIEDGQVRSGTCNGNKILVKLKD